MPDAGDAGILSLADATFDPEVHQTGGVILVNFTADWCIDCRIVQPTLELIAREYAGRARIAKLDVGANPATNGRFAIGLIPTLICFRDGQEVGKLVNVKDKLRITDLLDDALAH